jgi:protein phosphatase
MQSKPSSLVIPSPTQSLAEKKLQCIFSSYSIANARHPERNEDTLLTDRRNGLAAVFDGVGGSIAGEVASQIAADTIKQGWKNQLKMQAKDAALLYGPYVDLDIAITLEQLVLEAHDAIRDDGAQRRNNQSGNWGWIDDQATTIALAVLTREANEDYVAFYAHVGDSRVYRYRPNEQLTRLTEDDSILSKLVASEQVNKEQAERIDQAMKAEELSGLELACFQQRNGITQALGDSQIPFVHIKRILLAPGDRLLLCTDGIHDNLTDAEMAEVLQKNARGSAKRLVERAQQRSQESTTQTIRAKADDMSAIVVTCNF